MSFVLVFSRYIFLFDKVMLVCNFKVSINFKPSNIFFMLGDLKGTTGVILGKYQEYWGSTCREA